MKIKLYVIIITSCFLFIAISSSVNAETLKVTVTDKKGNPISDAHVTVTHLGGGDFFKKYRNPTDSDGEYQPPLPSGIEFIKVKVRKIGYRTFRSKWYNFYGGHPYEENEIGIVLQQRTAYPKQLTSNPILNLLNKLQFLQKFLN
jgi:hypothetical protein